MSTPPPNEPLRLHACSIINHQPGTAGLGHTVIFIVGTSPSDALAKALQYCEKHHPGQTCNIAVNTVPESALVIRGVIPQAGEFVTVN